MYQRFPGGADSPQRVRASAPQSVLRAVKAMYVGLAVSLIGIAIDMTTLSATRSAILKRDPTFTAAQLNNAEHVQIGLFIASGLIGAALWLWMAQSCLAGKRWARIVSTVFFAIETVAQLGSTALGSSGGVARLYGLLVWLVGLVAVVLLWQRSSSEYFNASR